MTTLNEFHLFPILPTELKLKIYRLVLSPRAVPVRLRLDLDAWNWSSEKDWWTSYSVVADADSPRTPLPTVLSARYEAMEELMGLYKGMRIDGEVLKTLLIGTSSGNKDPSDSTTEEVDEAISLRNDDLNSSYDRDGSAKKLLDNLLSQGQEDRRPPFNPDQDILVWKDTQRWVSCGDTQLQTLVHPLFLASCLSVRHVRIEYAPCMANLLESLSFSVLDKRRPLESLDISVRNPSDCRVLRFRLCKLPKITKLSGERRLIGKVMAKETHDERVEEMVRRWGLVWFPWFQEDVRRDREHGEAQDPLAVRVLDTITSPSWPAAPETPVETSPLSSLLSSAPISTANTAILQVVSASDPTTGPGASGTWARVNALADPTKVSFRYQHSDEPLSFGLGNLQTDILLWCHGLKLHGAGYPANLPFDIVGVPCHGFCDEDTGSGG